MHVGVNLIFLVPGETGGMEVYARELVPRLAAKPGVRVTAFVGEEFGEDRIGSGVGRVVVPVRASNRLEWVRGEQLLLPGLAARMGCDVVHSLASTAPLRGAFTRVVTIHDLHYKLVPEAHFGLRGLGMRALVPAAARTSDRVIAISHATASDLFEHLGTARSKVDVVPQGVAQPCKRGQAPFTRPADLRARMGLGDRPVLLSASAKRPHKNLLRLLEAHAALAPPRPVLVLPGYPTPHEDELRARAAALGTSDDVRFEGWLSREDLDGLYALAGAFVFPSLQEGFGLPVLEAMARGVPVATSDRGAMAEVAGDAALLFDPESVPAITRALERLLGEPALREELRAAGPPRAAGFTWDATAAGTLMSYERALAL